MDLWCLKPIAFMYLPVLGYARPYIIILLWVRTPNDGFCCAFVFRYLFFARCQCNECVVRYGCFFFPSSVPSYFVFIDSLSLKLVDVLVLEEWCKVIILDSIIDSRFASLQQVLLASLLFFDLFSCWSASLNCLEDENSKRGLYDLHLYSSR